MAKLFMNMNRFLGKITVGDCFKVLQDIPDESIDMVFTSPPYGAGIAYDNWDDSIKKNKILLQGLAHRLYPIMKKDGRVALEISTMVVNDGEVYFLLNEISNAMLKAGFKTMTMVVWDKTNNGSTAWGSYGSPSCPNTIGSCECILVFYKEVRKKIENMGQSISGSEWMEIIHNIWRIPSEYDPKHPVVFPPKLARNAIKLWSYPGDIILDPFTGSGTTLLEAEKLKRRWIGIEISEKYASNARSKLTAEVNQFKLF